MTQPPSSFKYSIQKHIGADFNQTFPIHHSIRPVVIDFQSCSCVFFILGHFLPVSLLKNGFFTAAFPVRPFLFFRPWTCVVQFPQIFFKDTLSLSSYVQTQHWLISWVRNFVLWLNESYIVLNGLNKQKHFSLNGQSGKAANVQRNTLKDVQKAWRNIAQQHF